MTIAYLKHNSKVVDFLQSCWPVTPKITLHNNKTMFMDSSFKWIPWDLPVVLFSHRWKETYCTNPLNNEAFIFYWDKHHCSKQTVVIRKSCVNAMLLSPDWGGGAGYPIQSWTGGTPSSPQWGREGAGTPSRPEMGYPLAWTRDGVPPQSRPEMWYPPTWTWDVVPPPPTWTWDGVSPPPAGPGMG